MERFYSKSHEWIEFTSMGTALIGVTSYLVEKQKNPSFINLCDEGDYLIAGDNAGDIEFLKGVFDVLSPVSGVVKRVNDDLLLHPKRLKENPWEWLFELEEVQRPKALLTESEYEEFIRTKEKRNG